MRSYLTHAILHRKQGLLCDKKKKKKGPDYQDMTLAVNPLPHDAAI